MAATQQNDVLATNFGSENFPVEWEEGEKELFWIHDDLHIPNPVSPLFFDIGGWWLTCDHMFRRFGTPFACDWVAKNVNGYVYTAAIPCDPALRAEATEYESRYAPRTPRDPEYAGQIGAYLGGVLPIYASNFMQWWKTRLRPEIERNFEYLDGFDYAGASLLELAVLLEDAIDVHDRHWKIHWMLNFAQFASTTNLNAVIADVGADTALMGRLQSSVEDRNWDAIEDLWKAKEEVKGDAELQAAFEPQTASEVMAALAGSERGRRFVSERIQTHQRTFGYKSIWSHEMLYTLWVEDPAPIVEAIRGYVATDYDYPTNLRSVHDDLEDAKRAVMAGVEGADREKLAAALQLSLNMNPLTPDHHFYVDQGTNARLRVAAIAIGRKLVEAGALADPEDVVFLHYNELRRLMADPQVVRRPGARVRSPRRARGRVREAVAVVAGNGDAGGAGLPLRGSLGLPGALPRRRAVHHGRAQGPRGVARHRGGPGPLRLVAGGVRPGAAGRDPRVPDDQPGVGGALHEDRRARHRGGRNGLSPRGRGAGIRDPRGRGHRQRRRAHQDG